MAGIYDYINQFWAEAERSPFNPTEVALYHYLLYEAKHRKKGKDAFEENLAKYTGISNALCCVDLTDYDLPDRTYPESIERITNRINIHFEIGKTLNALMKPTLDADMTPEDLVSIDGDYKARIPAKVFRNGASIDLLINRIIEKSIQ